MAEELTEQPPGAGAERLWSPLYLVAFAALAAVAVAQIWFLVGTMAPPRADTLVPSVTASSSAAPLAEAPPEVRVPAVIPPPPPGLRGKMLVPPRVLFEGLIEIQRDPRLALKPAQRTRVKALVEKWIAVDHTVEKRILPAVAIRLAALSGPQRDFIQQVQRDAPDASALGAPAWDDLLAMLAHRAGNHKARTKGEAPQPSQRDAEPFLHVAPPVIVTALLRMDHDPALQLTPSQATSLIGPVKAWRKEDGRYLQIMVAIGDALGPPQRAHVERLRLTDREKSQEDPRGPRDALPFLSK
jgi:hypothetical protein